MNRKNILNILMIGGTEGSQGLLLRIQEINKKRLIKNQKICLSCVNSYVLAFDYLKRKKPNVIFLDLSLSLTQNENLVGLSQMISEYSKIPMFFINNQSDSILSLLHKATDRKLFSTEREKIQLELIKQLELKKSLFENVLNTLDDAILVLDPKGEVLFANPSLRAVIGQSSNLVPLEERSKSYGIFLPDKMTPVPPHLLPSWRALKGEYVVNYELYLRNKLYPDGIFFLLSAIPIKGKDQQVLGAVLIYRNINKMKQTEWLAQESMKVKSDFLSNMSHELRTPLNSILGLTALLKTSDLSNKEHAEKNYEFIEMIHQSGLALLNQITDLLDYSKIEKGTLQGEIVEFEVARLINEGVKTFNPIIKQKGIQIDIKISHEIPKKLKGDLNSLKRVFINLLSNSVKFTQKGQISVQVMKGLNSNIATELRVEITDTGIGIPKENEETIFVPFLQLDAEANRKEGGVGLGLSLSKQLIKLLKGTMGVRSQEGRGSTFWFQVMFEPAHETSSKQDEPLLYNKDLLHNCKHRILIVEDNQINQFVMLKVLEKLGYQADIGCNGREALELLNRFHYDLVLMDCQMPILDGYEATRLIRENRATNYNQIPIIAVTANVLNGEGGKCIQAGMNDYLGKPVKIQDLNSKISQWISV